MDNNIIAILTLIVGILTLLAGIGALVFAIKSNKTAEESLRISKQNSKPINKEVLNNAIKEVEGILKYAQEMKAQGYTKYRLTEDGDITGLEECFEEITNILKEYDIDLCTEIWSITRIEDDSDIDEAIAKIDKVYQSLSRYK